MKIICITLVVLAVTFKLSAQEWTVPPDKAAALSPLKFTDETRQAGQALYTTYCKQCHGDPGKGNVIALTPPPPDPATPRMQNNTDGGIFYKVTEGRGPMLSFKNTLSAFNIWNIISYIRSFNPQYVQKVATIQAAPAYSNTHIKMTWLSDYFQVVAVVTGEKDHVVKPVRGTEVKLFARRYFGNILIDGPKNTDSLGKAVFTFPTDLPGDSSGFVKMFTRLTDEGSFGEAQADTSMNVGVPTWKPPLNEERALWNVVQKTPIWLLLTYSLVVLSVWGIILYVVLQLRAVFMLGKIKKGSNNL